jgi:hypothetical protein
MAEANLSVPNTSDALKDSLVIVHKITQEALPSSSSAQQTATSASASKTSCAAKEGPVEIKQVTLSKEHFAVRAEGNDNTREELPQDSKGIAGSKAKCSKDYLPADQDASFPDTEQHSEQLQVQASNLQPPTPPLSSPAGASPTSRTASVTEGEETSRAGPSAYPPLDEIAEGIRAAIRSNLRCASL